MPLFSSAGNPNRQDPSLAPTMCEFCGLVQPLKNCHSIGVVHMMPGFNHERGVAYGAYQCPDTQHFACCNEHAMLLALCCLYEHIQDGPDDHEEKGQPLTHPTLLGIKQHLTDMVDELVASGKATRVEKENDQAL